MTNGEDYIDQVTEILRLVARTHGGKGNLMAALAQETGEAFPPSISYRSLVKRVEEKGLEKDFCRVVFDADSFVEVAARHAVVQGLSLLSVSEILEVADYLSDNGHAWKYDRSSGTKAVMAVAERVSLDELNECLSQLMATDRIELAVHQNKKWVIGPLGIVRASSYRKAGAVWSLRKFLKDELHGALLSEFVRQSQWLPATATLSSSASDQYKQQQLIQLVLTHGTDSDIFSTINKLIANHLLNPEAIRFCYWNIVSTPCGVFNRQYNGVNRLAALIVNECPVEILRRQLSQKRYFSGDVALGAVELCLRENPPSILEQFFSWADLMRIAERLDLVRVDGIGKSQLAEVIAIRLGFDLPAPLEGLADLRRQVEEGMISLTEQTRTAEEVHGIMAGIYRAIEAVLKDLLHFYVGFLWPESLSDAEPGEGRVAFNLFCRQQFGIDKADGVDGLTLGELVGLFHRLNRDVKQDPKLEDRVTEQFGRKFILPSRLLSTLEKSLKARGYLAHDKDRGIKHGDAMVEQFGKALGRIAEFLSRLKQKGLYPHVVRVRREVTDEYGRRYVEAVDEYGKPWLIHTSDYLIPSQSYFMHSVTSEIAVDPYLAAKLR